MSVIIDRFPSEDEGAGIAWWNGLSEPERAEALKGAYNVAEAWLNHKRAQGMPTVRLVVDMTEEDAEAMAQFLKRVGWTEWRVCAIDDDEARRIRHASDLVRAGLAAVGFAPR